MGVFKKGINGPFSGKTGSIIGSKWKSIHYMKGLPRVRAHRKASAEQLVQRQKFKLLLDFFTPMQQLLKIGFQQFLNRNTAINAAMKFNYDQALYEEEGEIRLDYSKVQLSHGALFTAGAEKAVLLPEGLKITWNTKTYGISGNMDDRVFVACYIQLEDWVSADSVLREDGEIFMELSEKEMQSILHVWIFLSNAQGGQASKTVYIPIERENEPIDNLKNG